MLQMSYVDEPARQALEIAKQSVSSMRKGHDLLRHQMNQVIKLEVGDSGVFQARVFNRC